jgi:hypothetical protein
MNVTGNKKGLGRETTAREPRWSVIRDVLGWVD